jgi:hypothetical protein
MSVSSLPQRHRLDQLHTFFRGLRCHRALGWVEPRSSHVLPSIGHSRPPGRLGPFAVKTFNNTKPTTASGMLPLAPSSTRNVTHYDVEPGRSFNSDPAERRTALQADTTAQPSEHPRDTPKGRRQGGQAVFPKRIVPGDAEAKTLHCASLEPSQQRLGLGSEQGRPDSRKN